MNREAFEAWAIENGAKPIHLQQGVSGQYEEPLLQSLWSAWSARDAEVARLRAENAELRAKDWEHGGWYVISAPSRGFYVGGEAWSDDVSRAARYMSCEMATEVARSLHLHEWVAHLDALPARMPGEEKA